MRHSRFYEDVFYYAINPHESLFQSYTFLRESVRRKIMRASDDKALQYAIAEITEIATGFGLDFYPMRYEICPAEIIYTFGAYGMPTRFSHWSFGKQFFRMKLQYDLGLSKIYELVINSIHVTPFY